MESAREIVPGTGKQSSKGVVDPVQCLLVSSLIGDPEDRCAAQIDIARQLISAGQDPTELLAQAIKNSAAPSPFRSGYGAPGRITYQLEIAGLLKQAGHDPELALSEALNSAILDFKPSQADYKKLIGSARSAEALVFERLAEAYLDFGLNPAPVASKLVQDLLNRMRTVSADPCKLCASNADYIADFMARYPAQMIDVKALLGCYLNTLPGELADLYNLNAAIKLIASLSNLSRRYGLDANSALELSELIPLDKPEMTLLNLPLGGLNRSGYRCGFVAPIALNLAEELHKSGIPNARLMDIAKEELSGKFIEGTVFGTNTERKDRTDRLTQLLRYGNLSGDWEFVLKIASKCLPSKFWGSLPPEEATAVTFLEELKNRDLCLPLKFVRRVASYVDKLADRDPHKATLAARVKALQ
jgi:hypothetical protein